MEVLTLLLTCLVNETTNETAIVYSYVSTKLNDTTAVMMNLPFSVLGFIPWFCNFTESQMGSKPETKDDWFWKPLKTLGKAIVGVIIFIGMAIVAFVELIVNFVAEILMEWLPILEYILWLIIRVIILVFIYIIFAFTLLIVILGFISISTIISILSVFMEIQISMNADKITTQGDINISFEYNIGLEFNNFLNLYIPTIETSFIHDQYEFYFAFSYFSINLNYTCSTDDLLDDFYGYGQTQSSNYGIKSSNSDNSNAIYRYETVSNIGDGFAQWGAVFTIVGGACLTTLHNPAPTYETIFGILFFITEIVLWAFTTFAGEEDKKMIKSAILGIAFGYIISGGIALISSMILYLTKSLTGAFFAKKRFLVEILEMLDKIFGVFGFYWSITELIDTESFENEETLLIDSIGSISGGVISLIVGNVFLLSIDPPSKGQSISKTLGLLALVAGLIALGIALDM